MLEYIGNLGSIFELRARLQWLNRVADLLKTNGWRTGSRHREAWA